VYEGFTDALFMDMGRELHTAGCLALQHPDVMLWDCKVRAGGRWRPWPHKTARPRRPGSAAWRVGTNASPPLTPLHPRPLTPPPQDSLVKLRDLPTGLPDTYVYYKLGDLKQQLPESLAQVGARAKGCSPRPAG
jgi:hypothetical protein